MKRGFFILELALALAILLAAGIAPGRATAPAPQAKSLPTAQDRPPTSEELHALGDRVIANQHRSDAELELYERVEHHVVRGSGRDAHVTEDKTYRVVPTGTGTLKLLLKDSSQPVDAATYHKQLLAYEQSLEFVLQHPDDPRTRSAIDRRRKRSKDRAELVDAIRQAYRTSWLGREIRDGRTFIKLQLDPNPEFQPRNRTADFLTHARVTIWLDEQSGNVARAEADIISDISFGGGILGKVYRGGHFILEQAEVAPGVWLPTRYQYDFSGRKFLFGFEVHELTEASRYRRLGPPREALEIVRLELQSKQGFPADP